jgi:predicted transposase YdaD
MLETEWNFEDALAVRFREGMETGRQEERQRIARNVLAEGISPEVVSEIVGMDLEAIQRLSAQ